MIILSGYALRLSQMQGQLPEGQRTLSAAARRERVPDGIAAHAGPAASLRSGLLALYQFGQRARARAVRQGLPAGSRQCCSWLLGEMRT
jgi:hypothetical protein